MCDRNTKKRESTPWMHESVYRLSLADYGICFIEKNFDIHSSFCTLSHSNESVKVVQLEELLKGIKKCL